MGSDGTGKHADPLTSLHSDRSIKKLVGNNTLETKPYLVQQSTLEHATEYFRRTFRNEHFGDNESGILAIPEDDTEAWDVFLYWLAQYTLPPTQEFQSRLGDDLDFHLNTGSSLAVRSWSLSDKYHVPTFQGATMHELLRSLEFTTIDLQTVREAFEITPSGSNLREGMAEEIVMELSTGPMQNRKLEVFDGLVGFTSLLVEMMTVRQETGKSFLPRVSIYVPGPVGGWQWKRYVVGEASKLHWVYHGGSANITDTDD